MIKSIEIRPAKIDDAKAIIDVHYAAVHKTAADYYDDNIRAAWSRTPDQIRYESMQSIILEQRERVLVACSDGSVLGFASLVPENCELRAVYVRPKAGCQGVGSQLLRAIEALALSLNISELNLKSSLNAQAFYQQNSYITVGDITHILNNGLEMSAVEMTKKL